VRGDVRIAARFASGSQMSPIGPKIAVDDDLKTSIITSYHGTAARWRHHRARRSAVGSISITGTLRGCCAVFRRVASPLRAVVLAARQGYAEPTRRSRRRFSIRPPAGLLHRCRLARESVVPGRGVIAQMTRYVPPFACNNPVRSDRIHAVLLPHRSAVPAPMNRDTTNE